MAETLDRDVIWELAQGVILGPELVTETFAAIDSGDESFYPGSRLHELVEEKRDEALQKARKDRSFLRIRVSDLATERGGRASEYDAPIFYALDDLRPKGEKMGGYGWDHNRRPPLVEWPQPRHPEDPTPRDGAGYLTGTLDRVLAEQKPTWVDLLTKSDGYHAERLKKKIGDPHQPEEVALSLIKRRLSRVASELSALTQEWRQELEAGRKLQAEQAEEQAVSDAWSGFFGEPEKPKLASERAARERPVAPQLGDGHDLGL